MTTWLVDAILFDLDGTLVDSAGSVERSWRKLAEQDRPAVAGGAAAHPRRAGAAGDGAAGTGHARGAGRGAAAVHGGVRIHRHRRRCRPAQCRGRAGRTAAGAGGDRHQRGSAAGQFADRRGRIAHPRRGGHRRRRRRRQAGSGALPDGREAAGLPAGAVPGGRGRPGRGALGQGGRLPGDRGADHPRRPWMRPPSGPWRTCGSPRSTAGSRSASRIRPEPLRDLVVDADRQRGR